MPLNRDQIPPDVLEQVNVALDTVRAELGLTSDAQLASHYNIAPKTISHWRNGIWPDNDAVLIGFILARPFWKARPLGQRKTAPEDRPLRRRRPAA